jgi:hypothetical protein
VEFCKKKEENCIAPNCKEKEIGEVYTYLAYKRETDFFIGFVVGKWNDFTCNLFYEKLSKRLRFPTRKRKLTIFSDGNKQNMTAIPNNFPKETINYGCKKKIRKNGKIVGAVNRIIFGCIPKNLIAINHIDGFCSKLRERISCFTRKGRGFGKKKKCLEQRLEIFSVQHNFMEKKKGKTPAMKEGLINKPLSWETFFLVRLRALN